MKQELNVAHLLQAGLRCSAAWQSSEGVKSNEESYLAVFGCGIRSRIDDHGVRGSDGRTRW